MRGLVVFGFLISTIIVCVLSENDHPTGAAHSDNSEVAVRADQLAHVRSKRSPHDPIVPGLILGKSFLLGALLGRLSRGRGWGWRRPRPTGWGWKPRPVHHVQHVHSHGGWGGWEPEPLVSVGWGWAR